ncbi:MAG: glucose/galactose transporter family protein [uncultured Aureispira sp.]|uniref:Glucose/galactose transporter family protein n=1 Tax=uncultured Aureispira sp. TaxID=1331704 RepID=A0A6S6SV53_9BACT|nr:MAG: glucose/galactose transporter family protein [uncultured Aureispira sp.]
MAGQIPNNPILDDGALQAGNAPQYKSAFAILTSLFFMWGFITVVNDPLISAFKKIFDLQAFHAGLVQSAFFIAFFVVSLIYFLVSTSKGEDPINKIGYKKGMSFSLGVCSLGCFAFYPSALAESYPMFLASLFILASGVTLLQICANPYAAIMGSKETASSRLNLAQGFNSLGTTLAPLAATLLIFKVFTTGTEPTLSAISSTYLITGSLFLALALLVWGADMPAYTNAKKTKGGLAVLQFPQLKWGIGAIFFYVGGEVAIGSWLMTFMENVFGFEPTKAGAYLAFYWGGAMIGRLLGAVSLNTEIATGKKYPMMAAISVGVFGFIYLITGLDIDGTGSIVFVGLEFSEVLFYLLFLGLNYVAFILGKSNAARSLSIFCVIVIALLLVGVFSGESKFALWALLSIGLFNSIMWSNIFTLAIKDLGIYTSQGSSLLVMAVVGGAFITPLQGFISDLWGAQLSFLTPIICYGYILFYGLVGHKTKEEIAS